MHPVRIRERLMDSAYPAWFMLCASSLLDGIVRSSFTTNSSTAENDDAYSLNFSSPPAELGVYRK